jgi:PAS domain S-box-containing protein
MDPKYKPDEGLASPLDARGTVMRLSPEETQKLVEDLRLHQTELELQNEELKRAQEVIEESRQKLADLYDFAPVAYLTLDKKGLIEEANLTASGLLGLARQQLVGVPFLYYVAPEYQDEYLLHRKRALGAGQKQIYELRMRRQGGELFWGRLETIPVGPVASDGQAASLRCAIIDITDRKLAEVALQESQEKYRTLVESVGSIIIRLDNEGRVVFLNEYGRSFFGYSSEELFAKGVIGTIVPRKEAGRLDVKAFLSSMAEHPERYREAELENRRQNGEKVWVSWSTRILRDEQGLFSGVLAVGSDLTQRRRLEEQLRHAQKMEALGTLTGGIAHDFNNILAAIIGFTELLRDRLDVKSHDRRYLNRVLEAGLRGRDLIRRMLAFSRKMEQEKKPILLGGVVTEAIGFCKSTSPSTVRFKVRIEPDVGRVLADPAQMEQVVLNLCTNAVQAMRDKGGVLDVEVSDRTLDGPGSGPDGMKPGRYARLVVSDTGSGMSAGVMERIFDPFFTTKKVGEGTGLGLSVVHGIVQAHDGHIFVQSEEGKGSRFTVYLPMVGESVDMAGETVTEQEILSGTERVLFVDDEELLVEAAKEILKGLGYAVTAVTSSGEALKLFKTDPGRFDLIMTDVTMPDMTGVELARRMLAIRADVPVIMCTGYSHLIDADAAKAAGIRAFAMKPLTRREIARTIRGVLDG